MNISPGRWNAVWGCFALSVQVKYIFLTVLVFIIWLQHNLRGEFRESLNRSLSCGIKGTKTIVGHVIHVAILIS